MEFISFIKAIESLPPGIALTVSLVVLGQAYTILRVNWQLRSLVEILATERTNTKTKTYPMQLFYDRGVITKKPLE